MTFRWNPQCKAGLSVKNAIMYLTNHAAQTEICQAPIDCIASDVEAFRVRSFTFQKICTWQTSPMGAIYPRFIDYGMPSIPPDMLDCVGYLYADRDSALEGRAYGGTCFFVGIESKANANGYYVYAVSNYHVAIEGGKSVIRLNTRDGKVDVIEAGPEEWTFIPGGGDCAAILLYANLEIHKLRFLPLGDFLTQEKFAAGEFGVGDDVFMLGRFIDLEHVPTNKPSARFGNISVNPVKMNGAHNGKDVEYFCLDMHSRSGFSGSPVFAFRTPGSDLRNTDMPSYQTAKTILGMHCGQFPDNFTVRADDGKESVAMGWSGMTSALPAWHIAKLLNCETLVKKREANDAEFKRRRWSASPIAEYTFTKGGG